MLHRWNKNLFSQQKNCRYEMCIRDRLQPGQTLTIMMGSLRFGNEPDISLGGMISSMSTVSYTHLDVYKRQTLSELLILV